MQMLNSCCFRLEGNMHKENDSTNIKVLCISYACLNLLFFNSLFIISLMILCFDIIDYYLSLSLRDLASFSLKQMTNL